MSAILHRLRAKKRRGWSEPRVITSVAPPPIAKLPHIPQPAEETRGTTAADRIILVVAIAGGIAFLVEPILRRLLP